MAKSEFTNHETNTGGVMKNSIVVTVLVAVLVGGAAFFGGMKFQQLRGDVRFARGDAAFQFGQGIAQGVAQNRGQGRMMSGNYGNGIGMMGRPVTGEITAQDDKSITVKLVDGSSKIILLSDSLTVSKTSEASKTDLKVGEKIGVFGVENSDGSVTAQTIQLNPLFRLRGDAASVSPTVSPKAK